MRTPTKTTGMDEEETNNPSTTTSSTGITEKGGKSNDLTVWRSHVHLFTYDAHNFLSDSIPYSLFFLLFCSFLFQLQLYYLNQGLRLCDTVLLVPLSFCAYNVSCLFNGLVYYNQWGRLYWWQILLILFGISQVLIGVLVLAWRPAAGEDYMDEDGDEATLLLPNASRPATPRHSRVFSFKGATGVGGTGAAGGGGGGGHGQDPSADARSLIHGFEMYDSDEDDGLDQDENNNTPLERQLHRRVVSVQDPRLLARASERYNQSESDTLSPTPPLQSSKSLTFVHNNRRSSK